MSIWLVTLANPQQYDSHIKLDAALILSSLAPVWTVILARCIFKEHVRAVQWFGIAVAIIAIQLISM